MQTEGGERRGQHSWWKQERADIAMTTSNYDCHQINPKIEGEPIGTDG